MLLDILGFGDLETYFLSLFISLHMQMNYRVVLAYNWEKKKDDFVPTNCSEVDYLLSKLTQNFTNSEADISGISLSFF